MSIETIIIPLVLVAGLYAAARLTRWINWFTFGENQARRDAARKRAAMREALRSESRRDHDYP